MRPYRNDVWFERSTALSLMSSSAWEREDREIDAQWWARNRQINDTNRERLKRWRLRMEYREESFAPAERHHAEVIAETRKLVDGWNTHAEAA